MSDGRRRGAANENEKPPRADGKINHEVSITVFVVVVQSSSYDIYVYELFSSAYIGCYNLRVHLVHPPSLSLYLPRIGDSGESRAESARKLSRDAKKKK